MHHTLILPQVIPALDWVWELNMMFVKNLYLQWIRRLGIYYDLIYSVIFSVEFKNYNILIKYFLTVQNVLKLFSLNVQ